MDYRSDLNLMSQMLIKKLGLRETDLPLPSARTIDGHSLVPYTTVQAECQVVDRLNDPWKGEVPFFGGAFTGYDTILGLPWFMQLNPDVNWRRGTLRWCEEEALPGNIGYVSEQDIVNCILGKEAIYVLHVRRILDGIQHGDVAVRQLSSDGTKERPMPPKFIKYGDCFSSAEETSVLAQNSEHDQAIDLLPGKIPPHLPIYNLSAKRLEILHEYIQKALAKG